MTDNERAATRARALTSLLVEKEIVTQEELERAQEEMATWSPAIGARAVAKAWADPTFRSRLMEDANEAFAELGVTDELPDRLVALANTPKVHNVVVCTLCSCYPSRILGPAPEWYKSLNYRARAVREPRVVLEEFGVSLDPEVEVRVYDSTADVRYLVVPMRPEGTEDLDEAALSRLVTRDSMVGVGLAGTTGRSGYSGR
ncbi:MAG: nitrile hydratase subunit alpha [Thermoplasmata archaeon]